MQQRKSEGCGSCGLQHRGDDVARGRRAHGIAQHVHGVGVLCGQDVGVREPHRCAALLRREHASAITVDNAPAVPRGDGAEWPAQASPG